MESTDFTDPAGRIIDAHPGKWVLLEITDVDEATTTPRAASLLGMFDTSKEAWRAFDAGSAPDRILGVYYSPRPEERGIPIV